jgi:hypothetical protein
MFFHLFLNALNCCEHWCINNGLQFATNWKLSFNAFVSLILLRPFTITFLISLTFVHAMCNQLHIVGLTLFILKSTHGSCPWSIYSLMTIIVHVWNWTLKTCFSGHCKIMFVSCSSFVQFAGMKMTKMLG